MSELDSDVSRLVAAVMKVGRRKGLGGMHAYLKSVAGVDLDRAEYEVLRTIDGGPIRVTGLAEELAVEPSTISRHVRRLDERGLIERLHDPEDARVSLVATSRRGTEIVARVEEDRRRTLAKTLESWDTKERRAFVELMERFATDLVDVIGSVSSSSEAS